MPFDRRVSDKKYERSSKGKANRKRYNNTVGGRAVLRRASKKYHLTEKGRAAKRHHRRTHKGKNTALVHLYGLTLAQHREMKKNHAGRCAICAKKKRLHIDHHHVTKVVRGLLCLRCNVFLAALDEPGWLPKALAYLEAS